MKKANQSFQTMPASRRHVCPQTLSLSETQSANKRLKTYPSESPGNEEVGSSHTSVSPKSTTL